MSELSGRTEFERAGPGRHCSPGSVPTPTVFFALEVPDGLSWAIPAGIIGRSHAERNR
jgi:hypothetical protein